MSSSNPIISVVTINRNNAVGLQRTISSVVAQRCKEFEYIVIDGASTDGSVDTIKRFTDAIDYWVSESDKGIYNAMNKALPHCHGQYVLFLNSGDFFADNHVIAYMKSIALSSDFVIGRISSEYRYFSLKSFKLPTMQSFYTFYNYNIPHQATFTRLSLLRELGGYDESIRVCSDWAAVFLAVMKHGKRVEYIDRVISTVDTTGISSFNGKEIALEKAAVFERYFPEEYLRCKRHRKIKRFSPLSIGMFVSYKIMFILRKMNIA